MPRATLVEGGRYVVGEYVFELGVPQRVSEDEAELLRSRRTTDRWGNDVPCFSIEPDGVLDVVLEPVKPEKVRRSKNDSSGDLSSADLLGGGQALPEQ